MASVTLGSLWLGRFENLLCDHCRRHRRGPAGVEGQVSDQLADLGFGDPIAERAFEVAAQLPLAPERDKRCYRNQAAIALREAGAFSDIAIDDLLGQFDELRCDRANLLAGGRGW
jgi:hypothetical protein